MSSLTAAYSVQRIAYRRTKPFVVPVDGQASESRAQPEGRGLILSPATLSDEPLTGEELGGWSAAEGVRPSACGLGILPRDPERQRGRARA